MCLTTSLLVSDTAVLQHLPNMYKALGSSPAPQRGGGRKAENAEEEKKEEEEEEEEKRDFSSY